MQAENNFLISPDSQVPLLYSLLAQYLFFLAL